MSCQRCKSNRIASITAKCSDCCGVSIQDYDESGYVPRDMGIGGGDYVKISWCLECGQIQGQWPLPESEAEQFDPRACRSCKEAEYFNEIGECGNCGEHKEMWCPKCESQVKVYWLQHYGQSHALKGSCGCIFTKSELLDFQP